MGLKPYFATSSTKIPPLDIYSRKTHASIPTDMYNNAYGNEMDLLCNIVRFHNRQKLETKCHSIIMTVNKNKQTRAICNNGDEPHKGNVEGKHPAQKKIYCIIPLM